MRNAEEHGRLGGVRLFRNAGLRFSLLVLVGLFCLGPVLWQAVTSVKPDQDLVRLPPIWPDHPTGSHYERVLLGSPLAQSLVNSAVVAASATIVSIVVGSLCGFALPRLQRTRGALVATLLLSAAWASWHWPAFLYRPGYSRMDLLAGAVGS